VIMSQVY